MARPRSVPAAWPFIWLLYHLPFAAVMSVTEAPNSSVTIGGSSFPVVLHLNHLIIYKSGTQSWVGIEVPIG